MKKLVEYLICITFGVVVGFIPYYIGTKEILKRPTVVNEFKKIKTKKDATTSVDVNTIMAGEKQEKKWRLFNREKK